MRTTAYFGLAVLLMLSFVGPVVGGERPQESADIDDKDYPVCVEASESRIKLRPKDANPYYRMWKCFYYRLRSINELAVAANRDHIAFINECNKTLMCDSTESKARIAELKVRDDQLRKDFESLRDKALDAFAKASAIGGARPEIAEDRTDLEKLYKLRLGPNETNPLDRLDDLIAQKKKELGIQD